MQNNPKIPKHVAFIMDGNGRWAKQRGINRTFGHREGVKRVKEIIEGAAKLGIKTITFFAFSTENWSRPKSEVDALMRYLDNFLDKEINRMHKNNVRFVTIGRNDPIPKFLQTKIEKAQEKTKNNNGLTVVLALNYGGRQEIVDAAKKFAKDTLIKSNIEALDENKFRQYFYAPDISDPDLLIRTSSEMRISNFLLWQLSYSEFYFSSKNWPDFKIEDLKEAITEYQRRERRFGSINVN